MLKRSASGSNESGLGMIEVTIALAVLVVAILAVFDVSSMMTRQFAALQSKNENMSKVEAIRRAFQMTGDPLLHALGKTFSGVALSQLDKTDLVPRDGNGNLMFSEGSAGPVVKISSYVDYDARKVNSAGLLREEMKALNLFWIQSVHSAPPPAPTSLPPPFGAVLATYEVHLPVMGQTAKQVVRNVGSVVLTFGWSVSDWIVTTVYNEGMIVGLKKDCERRGVAYTFECNDKSPSGTFDFRCEEVSACPAGMFKIPPGSCMDYSGPTDLPLPYAQCVLGSQYPQTNEGREAYCANIGMHANNYILAPPSVAGTFCPAGYIYDRATQTCGIK